MSTSQEKSNEELDEEFIKILRLMKPYITCIMNNHYIELIRLWLEKLSDKTFLNKAQRNKYLVALGRQIEAGVFEEPFTDPPPNGPLPPFGKTESVNEPTTKENIHYYCIKHDELKKSESIMHLPVRDRLRPDYAKEQYSRRYEENVRNFPGIPKLDIPESDMSSGLINRRMNGDSLINDEISSEGLRSGEGLRRSEGLRSGEGLRRSADPRRSSGVRRVESTQRSETVKRGKGVITGLRNGDEVCNFKKHCEMMKGKLKGTLIEPSEERLHPEERIHLEDRIHSKERIHLEERIHPEERICPQERIHPEEIINQQGRMHHQERIHPQGRIHQERIHTQGSIHHQEIVHPQERIHPQEKIHPQEIRAYTLSSQHYSSPIDSPGLSSSKRNKKETDSSWYDISGMSSPSGTNTGSGDKLTVQVDCSMEAKNAIIESYATKMEELIDIIKGLTKENDDLKGKMETCERDLKLRNTKAETSIHNLTDELKCLKSRIQELADIKLTLQNSHYAVKTEWENSMTCMQKKIEEVHTKNTELKSLVIILEKKLSQMVASRKSKTLLVKRKLSAMHDKKIQEITNQHNNNLRDLQWKLTGKYEKKITEIKAAHEKEITFKDNEIDRLERLMKEQREQMKDELSMVKTQAAQNMRQHEIPTKQNSLYEGKIEFLQKCIVKLEKLYKKSEKDYLKQIAKLKCEMVMKDRTNRIMLSSQKADIFQSNQSLHKEEIDDIISKLEKHYQELVRKQQQQAQEDKKMDTQIIERLREEIAELQSKKRENF